MDFYSKTSDGTIPILTDKRLLDYVASFKDETFVTVSIKKTVSKRSNKQLRLWWVYMTILGDALGYTKEEMHEICKMKFCKHEKVDENTGQVFEYLKSTADYNKTEFNERITSLQIWAANDLGVILPDPDSQLNIDLNHT